MEIFNVLGILLHFLAIFLKREQSKESKFAKFCFEDNLLLTFVVCDISLFAISNFIAKL